jgi:hypothetical protein
MRKSHLTVMSCVLLAACGPAVPPGSLDPLNDTFQLARQDTDALLAARIDAEEKARRDAVIRAGKMPYVLSGCLPEDIITSVRPDKSLPPKAFDCKLNEIDQRAPTDAEKARQVLGLLSAYVESLDALTRSKSPTEVGASVAALLTSSAELATRDGGQPPQAWALRRPGVLAQLTEFGLERYRAAALRRAVWAAREPFRDGVETLVSLLVVDGLDPVASTGARLVAAEAAMNDSPGDAGRVADLEAAFAADAAARETSPAIRLVRLLAAHEALADRLSGPPSLEETAALVDELAKLRKLIEEE